MTTSAIELSNVGRRLGKFELGPLNLIIPRGSIFALIGPNAAGKTTLLDLLMGMGLPDLGRIELLGMNLATDEVAIKKRVAYVSPDLNYQAWGKIGNALDFVSGFYPDWDDAHCTSLLVQFELTRGEKIASLSFGSKIKLALVIALSRNADLLLLDEPTVGLDAVSRQQLFGELLKFMQKEDKTIVISSHQLNELERFADHVGIIHRGKMLLSGRMDELIERHRQYDVELLNGKVPSGNGIRVLKQDGSRVRLLVDSTVVSETEFNRMKCEVVSQSAMTLDELFVALVTK